MKITNPNLLDECRRRIQTENCLLRIMVDEYGAVRIGKSPEPYHERFVIATSDGVFMQRMDKDSFGIQPMEIYVLPRNVVIVKDGDYYLLNVKMPGSKVFIHFDGQKNTCFTYIMDNSHIAEYHGLPDRYLHDPAILPNVLRGMFPGHRTTLEEKEDAIDEKLFG